MEVVRFGFYPFNEALYMCMSHTTDAGTRGYQRIIGPNIIILFHIQTNSANH